MSTTISQFNVSFEAIHDRLMLKVLTGNDEEVRLWLTRRYVQALFQTITDNQQHFMHLGHDLAGNSFQNSAFQNSAFQKHDLESHRIESHNITNAQQTPSTGAIKVGADAQTSTQANHGSFSQSYQSTENTTRPYGEEPLLVSRITIKPQDDGKLNLVLGEEQDGGLQIELNLHYDLLQSLMQLLQEASNSAQWGLHYEPQLVPVNISPASARIH